MYKKRLTYYPLHFACVYHCSKKIMLQLLKEFPQAATETGQDGRYPLHLALRYSELEHIVLQLLKEFPQAATETCEEGRYPLLSACDPKMLWYNY
jgi:ankyrin repeat protein